MGRWVRETSLYRESGVPSGVPLWQGEVVRDGRGCTSAAMGVREAHKRGVLVRQLSNSGVGEYYYSGVKGYFCFGVKE